MAARARAAVSESLRSHYAVGRSFVIRRRTRKEPLKWQRGRTEDDLGLRFKGTFFLQNAPQKALQCRRRNRTELRYFIEKQEQSLSRTYIQLMHNTFGMGSRWRTARKTLLPFPNLNPPCPPARSRTEYSDRRASVRVRPRPSVRAGNDVERKPDRDTCFT